MKKNLILITLFLITAMALCAGCKTGATKEETKIFQEHSRLCKTEIHMQWEHYSEKDKEAIASRFKHIEELFAEILKEKK